MESIKTTASHANQRVMMEKSFLALVPQELYQIQHSVVVPQVNTAQTLHVERPVLIVPATVVKVLLICRPYSVSAPII
jgi:hypothetical protein